MWSFRQKPISASPVRVVRNCLSRNYHNIISVITCDNNPTPKSSMTPPRTRAGVSKRRHQTHYHQQPPPNTKTCAGARFCDDLTVAVERVREFAFATQRLSPTALREVEAGRTTDNEKAGVRECSREAATLQNQSRNQATHTQYGPRLRVLPVRLQL